MKPSFYLDNLAFFELTKPQCTTLIENPQFYSDSRFYKIPSILWYNKLLELPSPIRSSFCSACIIAGPKPSTFTSVGDTYLDIIRREHVKKINEPEFNVYRHFLIKNNDSCYYISSPTNPLNHWSVFDDIKKIYGKNVLQ